MTNHLDQLAFDFFKLFAQYESDLKEKGYFKEDKLNNVQVDWDRFANQVVGKNFEASLGEAVNSARYILENPPKRQVVVDRRVVWGDVPNTEKSVQILFSHICRVRNNLFHGAKFNDTWFDPERSEILIQHSLSVLNKLKNKLATH